MIWKTPPRGAMAHVRASPKSGRWLPGQSSQIEFLERTYLVGDEKAALFLERRLVAAQLTGPRPGHKAFVTSHGGRTIQAIIPYTCAN